MGYYSDVTIKCQEKAFGVISDAIMSDFHPDFVGYDPERREYAIQWECTKWYSSFPEISAIYDALSDLDNLDNPGANGYGYSFIRIGEEIDDTEQQTNDYDIGLEILRDVTGIEDCRPISFSKATPWKEIDCLEISGDDIGGLFL